MYQESLFPQELRIKALHTPPPTNFWDDIISGKIAGRIRESAQKKVLSSAQEAYNVMKPIFSQEEDVERMYGIYTDRKNRVISIDLIARGSISGASIYPREILKEMLAKKSCALVISHNHLSGDSAPSQEDFAITKHIVFALHCIGATLLDHVIIGNNNNFYSLADCGDLKKMVDEATRLFACKRGC